MKIKKIIKTSSCAVMAAVLLALSLASCTVGPSTGDYDYNTDIREVESVLNTTDKKFLVFVNKSNSVSADYAPDALGKVDSEYTNGGKSIELQKDVAIAAEALIKEMRACGITNVSITSGYRTYAYQQSLFDRYIEE